MSADVSSVAIIWSDDSFAIPDSPEIALCSRIDKRVFASRARRMFQVDIVATVALPDEVAPTLRRHWGPASAGDRSPALRVWIADLQFGQRIDAGLAHVREVCHRSHSESIRTNALIVLSSHTRAFRVELDELLGTCQHVQQKYEHGSRLTEEGLIDLLGQIVDRHHDF